MHGTQRPPHISFGSASGKSFLHLRISRRTGWNIALAITALALIAAGAVWGANKLFSKPAGSIGTTYTLQPGPWGEIAAQPILIEAPASLLSVNFRLGDGRWYFRANTTEEVAAFLRSAGLDSDQIARLSPGLQRAEGRDGLLVTTPPDDLVRSLSMDTRSALYDKLAAVPENYAQAGPFRTTDLHLEG